MANIDPVDLLTALDVKVLTVEGGNALVGTGPLAGQIKDFNGAEWEGVFREIENGGGMDYEAFRKLALPDVNFVSTRFSGDWHSMYFKRAHFRASASLESLLPTEAKSYVHEVVGRVNKVAAAMSNSGDPETTVSLKMIESYEVLQDGSRKFYYDRAAMILEIGGVDLFAMRRAALGL